MILFSLQAMRASLAPMPSQDAPTAASPPEPPPPQASARDSSNKIAVVISVLVIFMSQIRLPIPRKQAINIVNDPDCDRAGRNASYAGMRSCRFQKLLERLKVHGGPTGL